MTVNTDNPCEDLDLQPDASTACPDGQGRDHNGACVPIDGIPSGPTATPEMSTGSEEFPRQSAQYEITGGSEPPDFDTRQEPQLVFSSSTRDYTTVFNGSFASTEAINITLDAVNRRFAYPNHPSHWIKHQPIIIRPTVDRFRMALANMWHRLPDNPLEPSLMLHSVGDPRLGNGRGLFEPTGPTSSTIWGEPYKRIINIEANPARRRYLFDPTPGSSQVKETIRFTFPRDLTANNALTATDENPDLRYTPPDSGISEAEFLDVYMFGKRSDHYGSFKSKMNDRQVTAFYSSGSIDLNTEHLDYTYNAPAAFFEKELDKVLIAPSHSADIEVKIQNVDQVGNLNSELDIPSAYEFYQSVITKNMLDNNRLEVPNELANLGQWLQALMQEYENAMDLNLENDDFGILSSRYHKFPSNRVEKLEEINKDIRKIAQNFVEIKIKSRQGGPLASILQSTKMDLVALEYLGQDNPQNHDPDLAYSVDTNQRITRVLDDEFIGTGGNPTISRTVNDKTISNIPAVIYRGFDKLIETLIENLDNAPQNPNIEDYPLYYTGWDNKELLKIEEAISSQIFLTQLNLACREHKLQRSYADILYGRKAYAETIGYKIEKYKIVQDGQQEEKVQTFLLMDNNSIDRINFIDSQILPNQEYVYKIFTINLVIGSKYQYDSVQWLHGSPRTFELSVASDRMIILSCSPFFEKKISTKDKPPITPQVSFLPFNGIEDRYNILMNTNYGERLELPILIKPEDRVVANRMRRSDLLNHGKKVLYKSDSLPEKFEIFRIDFAPRSYEDFAAGMNYTVEATGKTGLFKLNVDPNKYYYYTFRAHDAGGVSNPTEVYKVRMVSYQNGIFMEMNTFEMERKPKDFSMNFQRFLHIKPNFMQSTINFSQVLESITATGFANDVRETIGLDADRVNTIEFQRAAPDIKDIFLGNTEKVEDRVWGKKFKIRVKSKSSGKVIDFNLSFNSKKSPNDDSV